MQTRAPSRGHKSNQARSLAGPECPLRHYPLRALPPLANNAALRDLQHVVSPRYCRETTRPLPSGRLQNPPGSIDRRGPDTRQHRPLPAYLPSNAPPAATGLASTAGAVPPGPRSPTEARCFRWSATLAANDQFRVVPEKRLCDQEENNRP